MHKWSRYNYNKRKDSLNGHWFRIYDIKCDGCGTDMDSYITTAERDTIDEDYCSRCLRKLFSRKCEG